MPVVAVVGGIAAASAGATAFAAAGGFAAGISAVTVTAGLTVVSGVATALGAATGNKKLMKLGAVTGIGALAVGGINALTSATGELAATVPAAPPAPTAPLIEQEVAKLTNPSVQGIADGLVTGSGTPEAFIATRPSGPSGLLAASPEPMALSKEALSRPVIEVSKPIASSVAQSGMGESAPGGVLKTATDAFKGFGKFANDNKGLTQMSLGMLQSVGQAQMAEEKMKEEERLRADARNRYNSSILNQRQAY